MQMIQVQSNRSSIPTLEYSLEGGVSVRDKTNGIAKIVYSKELTEKRGRPIYDIFINNRPSVSNGDYLNAEPATRI